LVFGDPVNGGAVLCKGYRVEAPDLFASSEETHDRLERDIRSINACLEPGAKAQWSFWTGNEFDGPLRGFSERTEAAAPSAPEWCLGVRRELFNRYWERKGDQTLLQGNCRLFLTSKLKPLQNGHGRTVRAFDAVFAAQATAFQERSESFDQLLAAYGGGVYPLDALGLYAEYRKFWSPLAHQGPMPANLDCGGKTLQRLCRFGERSPRVTDHGFYQNGHYFGVLAFQGLPGMTGMDTLQPLLRLAIPGLRVTVNVEALSVGEEIRIQARKYKVLHENVKDSPSDLMSKLGMAQPEERGAALLSGVLKPFRVQVVVVLYDPSRDGLDAKLAAVSTLTSNLGAEPYQPALWASAYAFYDCATPGYGAWLDYPDYRHKIMDLNAAHLVPVGSTDQGELDEADVIFDGAADNLIGWRTFLSGQPVATLVSGMTGSGKSATLQTVLTQAAHQYKFLAIVDSGGSSAATAQKLDPSCRPVVIRPNGKDAFNLFDCQRLPRSAQQLTDAAALAHLLVGSALDPYRDRVAQAVLLEHVQKVYDVAYERWRKNNPQRYFEVCREALTLLRFRDARMQPDQVLSDVFTEARTRRLDDPQALAEFEEIDPDEASEAGYAPETAEWVKDLAFAFWAPEEFPRLCNLQDELNASSHQKRPDAALCGELGKLLWRWTAKGAYGPILDGPNNVDLGAGCLGRPTDALKVVYLELGEVGKASKELLRVVGFLVANQLRAVIEGLPRAARKALVLEEMTGFLQAPEAETLVCDYFERMRKYSCQLYAVFQQWASLSESYPAAAKAMSGNCLAMLLFRNPRAELEALGKNLPPAVIDRIEAFELPSAMRVDDRRHAPFAYVRLTGPRPRVAFGKNFLSEDLEKVVTSSGDRFDQRQQSIKTSPSNETLPQAA
jgi:type IV secretion system protein TrbE